MNQTTEIPSFSLLSEEAGFDPIEERLRANVHATIEAMFEEDLADFLGRLRYGRSEGPAKGYRHGHRERRDRDPVPNGRRRRDYRTNKIAGSDDARLRGGYPALVT